MSRSGYDEGYDENPICYLWYSIVDRAVKGRRGQRAIVDFINALDAMPVKELIDRSFQTECGVCSLGALAVARGIDMSDLDEEYGDYVDAAEVGKRLDIAPSMARQVMFENDECGATPSGRWHRMRRLALAKLTTENRGPFAAKSSEGTYEGTT